MAQKIYEQVNYDKVTYDTETHRWKKQLEMFEACGKNSPSITENISKITLKLQDIQDAHTRIKDEIVMTPIIIKCLLHFICNGIDRKNAAGAEGSLRDLYVCVVCTDCLECFQEAKYIAKDFCNVFLKCENLQHTGSFKARGSCNVLSSMSPSQKSKGCTVSGSRNFLYAITYYGYKQSVPINVILPKDCPIADKQRYKENFALIKMYGSELNDANLHALSYSDEIESNYVHGSDRLDLLAGYGTLGLEILSQMDKIDAIMCPVGTGGLVASIVLAVKSLKPSCLIYGIESAASPAMTKALQEKRPILIQSNSTIAESLANNIVSNNALNILRGYLDRMITVDDAWISRAIIDIMEREKMIVEGAAACPIAALMSGKVPELRGKKVVCILTGGNINSSRISRVIDRGMAAVGRLVKFSVTVPDVPGAMARLLFKITEQGADIKSFVPERAWMRRDIFTVSANLLLETSDFNHAKDLEKKLTKDYPHSHFIML